MSLKKINVILAKNIKIISSLSILWISAVSFWIYSLNADTTVAPECKYAGKIKQCVEANSSLTNWPRTIEDFVCISSSSREKIAYNIVLDDEFKKIDTRIQTYLEWIEKAKNEYFWSEAQKTLFDWITDLNKAFSDTKTWFYQEYIDVCADNKIVKEALACSNPGTTLEASKFVVDDSGKNLCMDLAETKLAIFRQIATDLLKSNKHQIELDAQKAYMQKQRGKYDELIDNMSINQNYINKIDNKWNVVTKDTH